MIKVFELPENDDLSALSRELWLRKIGHQIRRNENHQELWLANPEDYPQLLQLVQQWQQGELAYTVEPSGDRLTSLKTGLTAALQWPVTLALLLISAVVTLLSSLNQPSWVLHLFSIVPFREVSQGLAYMPLSNALTSGEIWRLVTPALIHFGALHLIFNALWVWEFGRMIERQQSSLGLAVLFLISAISANLAQYAMGDILFGGLSGVVYALLGYCWFWDKLAPVPMFHVRKPVFVLLLVWLVFCMVGGATMLGFGSIANAAHVAGLVSGSLWAWLKVKWQYSRRR